MDSTVAKAKSAVSTPASSPGLYSPSSPLSRARDAAPLASPYLHPLQMHKVKETHKAQVEQDFITGRKLINQYEIIDEIGRGVHGKVKLARNLETNEFVAIKIIQRFSKKRRLGRVTVSPEDKTKREIAILKKVRHANVVGLLEVIDDPELKKIYMVLEHVELGEIIWRKKGVPSICRQERKRIEQELRGEYRSGDDEKFFKMKERRRLRKEALAEKSLQSGNVDYWSLEHGNDGGDSEQASSLSRGSTHESLPSYAQKSSHTEIVRSEKGSQQVSRATSRATSRAPSRASSKGQQTPLPQDWETGGNGSDADNDYDDYTVAYHHPGPVSLPRSHSSGLALEQHLSNLYSSEEHFSRGRAPSMADSIISHMSSVDDLAEHDAFEEDFSYVPCFTMEQARSTFRDTVLGLEYLHYQGIVHRDIKPANLLWTKEHRVKISDFGVSYFGRPIRDGEAEENISESDATDFDDDLELAKTVGTPAFFAPELCYTDLEVEQPKVTEQIDVWSLGVTLYCLIFARIPFLAEDEWQLFRAIAQQDIYIPRRRLKPVNPAGNIGSISLSSINKGKSVATNETYRSDGDLQYEEIDDELHDLISRMLVKDPTERMKLREVKRHPWVLKGIDNVIGWLDDTDPSRRTSGRRIQVDDRELERAVIPITFLERARSAMKKAVGTVGKVIGGRSEGSRRRAVSNATSSGGDTSPYSPSTPHREHRRTSLRGDETYFPVPEKQSSGDHPLAQSVTASPDFVNNDPMADFYEQTATYKVASSEPIEEPKTKRPGLQDRTLSTAASITTIVHRGHSHSKSVGEPYLLEDMPEDESPTLRYANFTDHKGAIIRGSTRSLQSARGEQLRVESIENPSRAQSTDRSLFSSSNKHGEPSVAISHAVAPGTSIYFPHLISGHSLAYSADSSPITTEHPTLVPSPHFRRPSIAGQQSNSTPNMIEQVFAASLLDDRPATATRIPDRRTPPPRLHENNPESFTRAHDELTRKPRIEDEKDLQQIQALELAHNSGLGLTQSCPPSPNDEVFVRKQEEALQAASTSSLNMLLPGDVMSPLTSPSEVASPQDTSYTAVGSANPGQPYPSDPSLPTLISSSSSVSADMEGDFLSCPGTVKQETTLKPVSVDQDSDSDSDEGLTMTRRKPPPRNPAPRRDTDLSICSTETAKLVDSK